MTAVAQEPVVTHASVFRRRRRSPLRRFVAFVTGAALAVTALLAISGAVTVVVQKLGFAPVLSPSMVPTFDPGDLLITKPQASSAVKVGQIIILPLPGSPGERYVHRVIKVSKDAQGQTLVNTRGDNNPAADPWTLAITSAQVPVVEHVVPQAGRLALLSSGAALRVPLLIIIAGGVLLAVKRSLLDCPQAGPAAPGSDPPG
jgi:signal peptidase